MLLDEAEQHRKEDDDGNDNGLERMSEESGDDGSREQNENQDVLKLGSQSTTADSRRVDSSSFGP